MTEVDEETVLARGMTDEETLLAGQIYNAIQLFANHSERSIQSQMFDVGISDLGTCSERTRRQLALIPPDEEKDVLEAFLGTAVGDYVERACAAEFENALLHQTVKVTLSGDGGKYEFTGHPDIVLPWLVIDAKTNNGLEIPRRNGPTRQQLFQRHLYALGAWQAGLISVPLAELRTANVWVDRSGKTKELFVHMDTFDQSIVDEATMWFDDVVYAWQHDEEARKEPPRQWCEKVCGHFASCRALDTDVEGLITDEATLTAVDMYREGLALEKQGKRLKDEAKPVLQGVRGNTGEFSIRWTHVNPAEVHFVRDAYDRLNISKMK